MTAQPVTTVAIVHGAPLEQSGFASRTLQWLSRELASDGMRVQVLVPRSDGPTPRMLLEHDLVVVGDLGGVYGEVAWVTALSSIPRPLVWMSHGYSFCADGSRMCGPCPLRFTCPSSDRVQLYRRLAESPAQLVYQSPLHRTLSERYLGAHPERTSVIGPVALPELPAAPQTLPRVAFADRIDREAWDSLVAEAAAQPSTPLRVHGTPPDGLEAPANLEVAPYVPPSERWEILAGAAELVCLPGLPLPLGEAAAAMALAGRRVTLGPQVGLVSHPGDPQDPTAIHALVEDSRARLRALVAGTAAQEVQAPADRTRDSWLQPGSRVLVWAHHLGLGDSINLAPFIDVLGERVGAEHVAFVLPEPHAHLLRTSVEGRVVDETSFDLAAERAAAELIIEVTIFRRDAHAGEILDERWLQLELDRQPRLFGTVHENLLATLSGGGLEAEPRRPNLSIAPPLREHAQSRLQDAGCDLERELVLAFHPGAGGRHKCWSAEAFARLAARARRELGANVVLVTGPGEEALAAPFEAPLLHSRADDLSELAALLSQCHGFVGNDSGLMHLACAADCPPLAFFGPSTQQLWGPSHPDAVVVAARDEQGKRTHDLSMIDDELGYAGMLRLLRRVSTRAPLRSRARLAVSPLLQVRERGGQRAYRTPLAEVTLPPGPDGDPVAAVLADLPDSSAGIHQAHAPELLETLLAAAVVLPEWALRCPGLAQLYTA